MRFPREEGIWKVETTSKYHSLPSLSPRKLQSSKRHSKSARQDYQWSLLPLNSFPSTVDRVSTGFHYPTTVIRDIVHHLIIRPTGTYQAQGIR